MFWFAMVYKRFAALRLRFQEAEPQKESCFTAVIRMSWIQLDSTGNPRSSPDQLWQDLRSVNSIPFNLVSANCAFCLLSPVIALMISPESQSAFV